mmetsp:Transcript_37511/g.85110  ORF Transcript_37511/g.85110 Transcript_37511/m.85110 type:complete len:118 (-) Transcript_37511:19-372(-)
MVECEELMISATPATHLRTPRIPTAKRSCVLSTQSRARRLKPQLILHVHSQQPMESVGHGDDSGDLVAFAVEGSAPPELVPPELVLLGSAQLGQDGAGSCACGCACVLVHVGGVMVH